MKYSIVIIINSVLTLQVSTASLPHDCKPCEIKVVSNHTCSLHTCVCAGSRRVRVRLSGFRWQESVQILGVSSSAPFQSGSVPNSGEMASSSPALHWSRDFLCVHLASTWWPVGVFRDQATWWELVTPPILGTIPPLGGGGGWLGSPS